MKKFILFLVLLILIFNLSISYAEEKKVKKPKSPYSTKEFTVETNDGHLIHAYLTFPKTKMKGYPTIVMLHSLGSSSYYWIPLQEKLNIMGYAVLRIDLRGHGKSVYNKSFRQSSWRSYKDSVFLKYPSDVIQTMDYVKNESNKVNFNNWAIIGSDIGANTAVIVADKYSVKPKAIVLFAPSMTFKGLYIPVMLTELGTTPILAIASIADKYAYNEQIKLKRFAQSTFDTYNVSKGGSNMLITKYYPESVGYISNWLSKYIK